MLRSFETAEAKAFVERCHDVIETELVSENGLLLPHAQLMDRGVRYLLQGAPSQPGGPLAPRVDDDELRADEEALRARHLARLRNRDHKAMLRRLRNGEELPNHEPFEDEEDEEEQS